MKKILLFTFFASVSLSAQNSTSDLKYRRSSLSMILVESESFPNKDAVMSSWNNYPFPEKYNKHLIGLNSANLESIVLTDKDLLEGGFLKDTLKTTIQILKASLKPIKYLDAEQTTAVVLPNENEEYRLKIDKMIKEKKLANKLVSSWFNLNGGKFDMSLIQQRGSYNASLLEAGIASGQVGGVDKILGDAGEELIKNTFVTFTKLKFVENEPIARAIADAAKESTLKSLAGSPQFAIDLALKGIEKVYNKTKEGYSLWSNTWLFKLNWDEKTANTFYSEIWNTPSKLDNSDLFSLEFVNFQSNMSLVTFKLGETRTQEQIIDLALVRNIDNAFAKLQKENDVFKPKVPVFTNEPVTAQIGMKEGLEGGEKFEVLEFTQNEEGVSVYKKVGTVTVDKKQVWDNRYNAGQKTEIEQLDKDGKRINATLFKGNAPFGALLKQVK